METVSDCYISPRPRAVFRARYCGSRGTTSLVRGRGPRKWIDRWEILLSFSSSSPPPPPPPSSPPLTRPHSHLTQPARMTPTPRARRGLRARRRPAPRPRCSPACESPTLPRRACSPTARCGPIFPFLCFGKLGLLFISHGAPVPSHRSHYVRAGAVAQGLRGTARDFGHVPAAL